GGWYGRSARRSNQPDGTRIVMLEDDMDRTENTLRETNKILRDFQKEVSVSMKSLSDDIDLKIDKMRWWAMGVLGSLTLLAIMVALNTLERFAT
ncbi:MAG: hypothetical protein L0Y56_18460, partial [Nitrospira sp.]|nr:hypothetical protein [Nitrospira sp.]